MQSLRVDNEADFLQLDAATLANLEILESRDAGRPRASLWSVVNATRSAMGARTLRRWITRPLKKRDAIFDRHDAVDELTRSRAILEPMTAAPRAIADLERLASRVTLRSATPRECLTLADSLVAIDDLRSTMKPLQGPLLGQIRERLDPLPDVVEHASRRGIDRTPPLSIRDGGVIKAGVDAGARRAAHDRARLEVDPDGDRSARARAHRHLLAEGPLQQRLRLLHRSLEVEPGRRCPADYIRKQTLVNAERYITPDLKELEEKIVGAEEKSIAIELRLYDELLESIAGRGAAILSTARAAGGDRCDRFAGHHRGAASLRARDAERAGGDLHRQTAAIRSSSRSPPSASSRTTATSSATATASRSSPARTWAASRPICARSR